MPALSPALLLKTAHFDRGGALVGDGRIWYRTRKGFIHAKARAICLGDDWLGILGNQFLLGPRPTAVMWKPVEDLTLTFSYIPITNVNARATCRVMNGSAQVLSLGQISSSSGDSSLLRLAFPAFDHAAIVLWNPSSEIRS